MIQFKIGQRVKAVDEDTHGVITKIDGDMIWIENEFGFDESYHSYELLPDINLEDEIEEKAISSEDLQPIKKESFKKKKNKITKQQIEEEVLTHEITPNQKELKALVEDNLSKNTEEFQQKLEERYKKEIKVSKKKKGTFVLDLHYGKLEAFNKQLPTQHILEKQISAAINGIEKAKNEGFKKIILVHGKGKGVLESEVKKYLREYGYTFYDANFSQYKLGATEVEL